MEKLKFDFSCGEDMLEAQIPDGYVHIRSSHNEETWPSFIVYGSDPDGEPFELPESASIVDAIQAADNWWETYRRNNDVPNMAR